LRSAIDTDAEIALGRRLSLVAERVLGHLPGDSGPVRALEAVRMLAARGIPAKVIMEVSRENSLSRTWVEVQGTRL
jgi:hypothetical protein